MPETTDTEAASPPKSYRVEPSIGAGFFLYGGYLAIFYTTWAINDVDYLTIGDTPESAKLHYALPTLFGCAFLVVAITIMGWWRLTLFDRERSGPRWAWIGPIFMGLIAISSLAIMNTEGATTELVIWSILGGIGVGFGEEMITRGALLVGFRTRFPEERVCLYTTLAFSALHIPNALFGESVPGMLGQLVLTFIFGSLLWATRRLAGTLLLSMFLHGIWDTSLFLPGATDTDPNLVAFLLYPVAIVCVIAVVRRNRGLRLA